MEENQVVYKCSTNHGLISGILELYSDRLVYTSNKGAVTTYNYTDITKAVSNMGCLEVKFTNGTSDVFSVDKELRLQMIDYINNKQVVQENNSKTNIQTTSNNLAQDIDTERIKQDTMNFANNVKTDVKNFKTLDRKKQIIYIVIGLAIIFVIMKIFGGSYSTEEKAFLENAEREISYKISATCGSVPSSDISFSVYKIDGSKCILKCKSSNSSVKKNYGTTFYAGCVQNSNFSYKVYVSEDLSKVKDYIDW